MFVGFTQQFLAVSATIVLEGSPTSYAQFRQWSGFSDDSSSSSVASNNATIEVDFRTEQADCLLLYADSRDGRYVQVTIAGGAARLRYNWGKGGGGGAEDAVERVLTVRDVGKVGLIGGVHLPHLHTCYDLKRSLDLTHLW